MNIHIPKKSVSYISSPPGTNHLLEKTALLAEKKLGRATKSLLHKGKIILILGACKMIPFKVRSCR